MSDILSKLGKLGAGIGRGVLAAGSLGASELAFGLRDEQEARKRQDLQDLIRIQSGQSQPAFARPGGAMPSTPEEFRQTQLAQLGQLDSPGALQAISALAPKATAPLSPVGKISADIKAGRIDPQTGRALIQKAIAPRAPLVEITSGQKREARNARDQLQSSLDAVNTLIKKIEEDPTRAGVTGVARGAIETISGVASDVIGFIPGLEGLQKDIQGTIPTLGESIRGLRPLQNKLKIGLARARQGDTGRLLSEQIKDAGKDTNIGAAISSGQTLDSLKAVRKEITSSLDSLFGRAGESGFELGLPSGGEKPKTNVIKLDENFNVIE